MFRFGWLDAYRRAIHRCILGSDESHSILSARLPLTLPIRSLSLNRFKPGIHCSSATRLPILSLVPSSLTESIFPRSLSPPPLDFIASRNHRDATFAPRLGPLFLDFFVGGTKAYTHRQGMDKKAGKDRPTSRHTGFWPGRWPAAARSLAAQPRPAA